MTSRLSIYLDLIRVLAALAVVAEHASDYVGGWIWHVASFGAEAVGAFFVLSGLVIAYVSTSREQTPSSYVAARAIRLYSVVIPMIFVTFLFDTIGLHLDASRYAAAPYIAPSVTSYLLSLTFTNQLWNFDTHFGTNGPYWSLGFEAAYYSMFGAVCFSRGRIGKVCALLLLLACFGPRIAVYFPLWLLGSACFLLIGGRWSTRFERLTSRFPKALWLTIFLGSLGFMFIVHLQGHTKDHYLKIYRPFELSGAYLATVGYFYALGIALALHIVAFTRLSSKWVGWIESLKRPIRWLAGATFTIYLANLPVMLFLDTAYPKSASPSLRLTMILISTFFLCLLLAELFERRKRLWKRMLAVTSPPKFGPSKA